MSEAQPADAIAMLSPFGCGWQLHRISPTTFPGDIAIRVVNGMSKEEMEAVNALLKTRNCYRCRIGKGRWHFGNSAAAAAQHAIYTHRKGKQ